MIATFELRHEHLCGFFGNAAAEFTLSPIPELPPLPPSFPPYPHPLNPHPHWLHPSRGTYLEIKPYCSPFLVKGHMPCLDDHQTSVIMPWLGHAFLCHMHYDCTATSTQQTCVFPPVACKFWCIPPLPSLFPPFVLLTHPKWFLCRWCLPSTTSTKRPSVIYGTDPGQLSCTWALTTLFAFAGDCATSLIWLFIIFMFLLVAVGVRKSETSFWLGCCWKIMRH